MIAGGTTASARVTHIVDTSGTGYLRNCPVSLSLLSDGGAIRILRPGAMGLERPGHRLTLERWREHTHRGCHRTSHRGQPEKSLTLRAAIGNNFERRHLRQENSDHGVPLPDNPPPSHSVRDHAVPCPPVVRLLRWHSQIRRDGDWALVPASHTRQAGFVAHRLGVHRVRARHQ
jgi:hypothetical protein